MEKRALLAIALSFFVLILWSRYIAPPLVVPPVEPGRDTVAGDQPPGSHAEPPLSPRSEPLTSSPEWDPDPTRDSEHQEILLETELYRITLDNRGGVVTSWILREYTDDHEEPLEIVSPAASRLDRYPLSLRLADPDLDERVNRALYEVRREEVPGPEGFSERVTFRYSDGEGLVLEKSLEISEGYLSRVRIQVQGPEGPLEAELQLGPGFGSPVDPKGASRFFVRGQAVLLDGTKVKKIARKQVEEGETRETVGGFHWAGLEETYFASVLVPARGVIPATRVRSHQVVDEGVARNFLSLGVPLEAGRGEFHLFVGPKDLEILSVMGPEMARMVDFRPRDPFGILPAIARGLLGALKFIHRWVHNFGWSIVLLTIGIRVLFFPLTHRSSVSMRRMQQKMKKVQPRIQAIKEKYRKHRRDPTWRQKMNQETMQIYQKEGINPLGSLGGCLPMLLQLPFLFGFYSLLMVAIELRKAPFVLWITDLSQKDPYYVTPIVMGLTMFLQQKMTTPVGMDPMQRRMMMMMPLMFTFFFVNFPSGLVLYWLVSNLLGIGQQYLINRQADRTGSQGIGARHGKLQRVSR